MRLGQASVIGAVLLIAGVVLGGSALPSSADDPPRNPAAGAGDGETYVADGTFPEPAVPANTASVGAQGLICCGADDRIQITDTTVYPISSIVWLVLYDNFGIPVSTCSGTFVGPNAILTAAHCLYSPATGFFADILVVPGADGLDWPFGSSFAQSWWVPDMWIQTGGSVLYDWGVIKLPTSDLGNTVGWMPVQSMSTATLERPDFTPAIIGYPGDKPPGTMWGAAEPAFLNVNDFTLDFLIDAAHGQSGSAVFSINLDEPFLGHVVGILSNGTPFFNSATRIETTLLVDILVACWVMNCSIDASVEDGPTVTPAPPPTQPPTPPPTQPPTPAPTQPPTANPTAPPTLKPTATVQAGQQETWGDGDCSGSINPIDSLKILRKDAGVAALSVQGNSCPGFGSSVLVNLVQRIWSDIDCSGALTPVDSLKTLRFDAGLSVSKADFSCPNMGQTVTIGDAATSTPAPTAPPTQAPTAAPTTAPTSTPTVPHGSTECPFDFSPIPIPDHDDPGGETGVTIFWNDSDGVIADLDICINIDHTWVGDLFVELEHMNTGTTVTLIDQPGVPGIDAAGCDGENIRTYLDDEAALPIENECGPSTPTIEGAFKPNSPLSAFDGESFDGEWQLRIYDLADDDFGEVVGATIWLE